MASRPTNSRRASTYLVHLDVDVLHTGLFPLANFPHFAGLTLEEVSAGLSEFTSGATFGGLVITEVNPDHDPEGQLIRTLVRVVTDALAGAPRLGRPGRPRSVGGVLSRRRAG